MALNKSKQRMLNKITDNGYDTDKKILALDVAEILNIPGITVDDIKMITELQSAIRVKGTIAYLADGVDNEKKPERAEKAKAPEQVKTPKPAFSSGSTNIAPPLIKNMESEVNSYDGYSY